MFVFRVVRMPKTVLARYSLSIKSLQKEKGQYSLSTCLFSFRGQIVFMENLLLDYQLIFYTFDKKLFLFHFETTNSS